MAALTIDASRAANPGPRVPCPARTAGPAAEDRSPAMVRPGRAVRSWPPRPRPRSGPCGSASRRRPGSAWSLRCRASGPRCTWTLPSPSRSASRHTRRTRCAPSWPATARSAAGPGGSPSGRRSAPSRWAWPGRSPFTCWPRPGWHGRRGRSPRSCPVCRSWPWAWGPRWRTCCAPTPTPPIRRTAVQGSQPSCGPCLVPAEPGQTRPQTTGG